MGSHGQRLNHVEPAILVPWMHRAGTASDADPACGWGWSRSCS